MRHETLQTALWWLCLCIAPLALIGLEIFHPAGFTEHPGMYEYLSKPEGYRPEHMALGYFGPRWWFTLHMLQTPLMALVGVGVWLLVGAVATRDGAAAVASAWLARAAAFVFLVYYTALDAIGGVGLGRAIEATQALAAAGELSDAQLEGVITVLNATWTDRWVGGVGSVISETASWAACAMLALAALARLLARRGPRPALLVLVAAGVLLKMSHAAWHGPAAFLLLTTAAVWLRRRDRDALRSESAG